VSPCPTPILPRRAALTSLPNPSPISPSPLPSLATSPNRDWNDCPRRHGPICQNTPTSMGSRPRGSSFVSCSTLIHPWPVTTTRPWLSRGVA
jgi:hypothetical protein